MAATTNLAIILTTSINNLTTYSAILGARLLDHAPRARNPSFQDEIDKVHSLCQKFIQAGIYNLTRQIGLLELKKRFVKPTSLSELERQQEELEDLRQAFASYQIHITHLEERISELTSNCSPAVLPIEWLNQFTALA